MILHFQSLYRHLNLNDSIKPKQMGKNLSVDLQAEIPGCICIMFMHLVESLESPAGTARQTFRLHTFTFVSLQLRNAVSLFGGMTIHDDEIKELTSYCTKYFRAYSWFLKTVKPTT